MAHAREHARRGRDARDALAAAATVDGGRRAGSGRDRRGAGAGRPGEPVELRAHVRTRRSARDQASVVAQVTTPTGGQVDVPMEWSLRRTASYTGRYVADRARRVRDERVGAVRRRHTALRGGALLADDQGADVEQAELRTPLLRRVANETGGTTTRSPRRSRLVGRRHLYGERRHRRDARDLWDMPIVFFLLVTLLGAEWIYRRRRGLA